MLLFFSKCPLFLLFFFFFFNDTATTEIYTLSLHDALPICHHLRDHRNHRGLGDLFHSADGCRDHGMEEVAETDRKSTRLNSSHSQISYAVFCLKKKKKYRLSGTTSI